MLNIEEIHNLNIDVIEYDNYEQALKNFVLFTNIDDKTVIAVTKQHLSISFDYLSKQDIELDVVFLNEPSFDRLYNKFIESKTDKQMSDITQTTEDAVIEEDDISIS